MKAFFIQKVIVMTANESSPDLKEQSAVASCFIFWRAKRDQKCFTTPTRIYRETLGCLAKVNVTHKSRQVSINDKISRMV